MAKARAVMRKIDSHVNVLQFISPTGFYGAERWILALAKNINSPKFTCELAITSESPQHEFKIFTKFKDNGGSAHRIEMRNKFDISAVSKLKQIIVDRNISLLHTHGYKSDIIGYLAAKACRIPIISTPHGYGDGKNLKLKLYIRFSAFFLSKFDMIVPLSSALVEETKRYGISTDRILQINNGVDLTEIPTIPKLNFEGTNELTRLGYVGQLIPRKRVHELILVFERLWRENNSLSLHIAGDGSDTQYLKELASSCESREAITFYGFVEDRLDLIRSLDAFIMTSESEGIPRVLMEAQALAIPVIAYDIDGVRQLILKGKTGLLVELGNLNELTKCCNTLIHDPILAKSLGIAGRERIQDEFSARRMADEYCKLYYQLLRNYSV